MKDELPLTAQVQQKNLAGHIHRFSRVLSSLSEHRWATDGFPEVRSGHVQLLTNLNLDGAGTGHTELAQRANITKQTMGRVIRELAESGYVTVTPDESDKRAQQVHLTDRGRSFLAYLATTLADLERAFGEIVGEEKLVEFSATLHKLMTFVEARRQQLDL